MKSFLRLVQTRCIYRTVKTTPITNRTFWLKLLEAEILYKDGKSDAAIKLLTALASEPNIPSWIREMAKQLLTQFK